jgi:hypothetical protein
LLPFVELYIDSHRCSSILLLVSGLISKLCLTDGQLDTISRSFNPALPLLHGGLSTEVDHILNLLSQDIKKAKKEDTATLAFRLASLDTKNSMDFAKELAEALAVLEDKLRRDDPVGEYIRWLARASFQDILSFPEQVSMVFSPCHRLEQLHRLKGW